MDCCGSLGAGVHRVPQHYAIGLRNYGDEFLLRVRRDPERAGTGASEHAPAHNRALAPAPGWFPNLFMVADGVYPSCSPAATRPSIVQMDYSRMVASTYACCPSIGVGSRCVFVSRRFAKRFQPAAGSRIGALQRGCEPTAQQFRRSLMKEAIRTLGKIDCPAASCSWPRTAGAVQRRGAGERRWTPRDRRSPTPISNS